MDPSQGREISERDQLRASLRPLRPEIDCLAAGEIVADERQRQIVVILARIVAAEMEWPATDVT